MLKVINIAEIVIAISLIVSILVQNRGAGLSSTFGGDFGGYHSKRGFEKFIVVFSSVLAVVFIILAIISLILSRA